MPHRQRLAKLIQMNIEQSCLQFVSPRDLFISCEEITSNQFIVYNSTK